MAFRRYHVLLLDIPSASHGRCAGFLGPIPCARRQRSERIHEAGHCIVHAAFGAPPIKAQIWRRFYEVDGVEKAFWGGQTLTADRELFALNPEVLELHAFFKQAAFYAAGALAEKRFDPDGLLPGFSLDERLVVSTMCRQAEDAFRLPKNAGGYVVEQIVMTLFDDFADLHAKLSSRPTTPKSFAPPNSAKYSRRSWRRRRQRKPNLRIASMLIYAIR